MGREGPLGHAELSAIDELLDAGELEKAQQRLAGLGQSAALDAGTSYLATRILYLRGRLDAPSVAERLRELLATVDDFPEARRMLQEAEQDRLPPSLRAPGSSVPPARGSVPAPQVSAPALELGFSSTPIDEVPDSVPEPAPASDPREHRERFVRTSSIPRAPGLPHFSEPPDSTPSYAPETARRSSPPAGSGDGSLPWVAHEPPPHARTLPGAPGEAPADLAQDPLPGVQAIPDLEPSAEVGGPQHISDLAPPAADADPDRRGRYSEHPPAPDRVVVRGKRPLPRSEPPDPGPPVLERPVRSGAPPAPTLGALPSLFELATLLDEHEYRRIINAIDSAGDAGPGYVLMRARALAGEGHRSEALATLERLTRAPLLDPELRAGAARVLVELGDLPGALAQARQAHDDDPEPPLVRVTLAWALLRGACRQSDARGVEEASELLSGIGTRRGPRPALVAALRALEQALGGDPERAIGAAQRALALDGTSTDALTAIALASGRLERAHDAQQAWLRLLELSYEQADAISDELEALGVKLAHLDPSLRPGAGGEAVFEPLELMPGAGRRADAIAAFEQLARARLTQLAESGAKHDFSIIAPVAASFLATTAIARDFAPYDLSLWSLARLDALAETLYGGASHPRESDDFPVILLFGCYLGEAIRGAYQAKWEGSVARIDEACVVAGDRSWAPFEMVRERIERGTPLDAKLEPETEAWAHRIATPAAPPCPWDPLPWPAADTLEQLGRALGSSPIGAWCAEHAGGPLDLSMPSLAALDRYVETVAPLRAPSDPDAPWARRPAVLLGAYLGEVLRAQLGGSWQSTDEPGARGYALRLGSTLVTPVVSTLERLEGQSQTPLSAYARRTAQDT
jgi:tetratricopeptide (TPR) repeat protein